MALYIKGDMIRFTYSSSVDKHKEVLVLNEIWLNHMHGLDLKLMTAAEREVLRVILDPRMKGRRHRLPLVNDILSRLDPPTLINEPFAFYHRFVKPFISGKDVYRKYFPAKMTGVQKITTPYTTAGGKPGVFGGTKSSTNIPKAGVADVLARALKLGGSVAKDIANPTRPTTTQTTTTQPTKTTKTIKTK